MAVAPVWTLPAHCYAPRLGDLPEATLEAALTALEAARAQLEEIAAAAGAAGRSTEAEVFGAQALIAADATLIDAVRAEAAGGLSGAAALVEAGEAQAAALAATGDEYLAARAADVRDVVGRALRNLAGTTIPLPTAPSILVSDDLPPSVSAEIPRGLLLGIALRGGSRTAHAVILARAAGIPCIVATRDLAIDGSLDGEMAVLDGGVGTLQLAPDAVALTAARDAVTERAAAAARRAQHRGELVTLRDGSRVHLFANVGSPADVVRAVEAGAEGVGLLRSEFLLLDRSTPPTEAEQVRALAPMFTALGPNRPLTLRLADIGGDKEIPYLKIPHEANPFLGVRGYRLATMGDRPDLRELFAGQVRAALLAAAASGGRLRIMAPMISVRAEVDDLLALVAAARRELAARGDTATKAAATYAAEIGVMIEVPAAALTVATLAAGLDFVSIGTNDLTQYALAADRVNPALAALQDAASPGVVALIDAIVAGAATAKVEVGVCGELAGTPTGARLLVAHGIRELSLDPAGLDEVREALIGA